jgi:hypothetical protein
VESNIATKAFYANDENMKSSLGLFDEGDLQIFDSHLYFRSAKSEINIEKERIKNIEIINRTPGVFEFAIVIIANLIIIAGYFGFEKKSVGLFILLLLLANTVLYFPLFREKWIKVKYLESGEPKNAYFRASSPFEVFNTLISSGTNNDKVINTITNSSKK